MAKLGRTVRLFMFAAVILLGSSDLGSAHSGRVDGYGCHPGKDNVSYHCHQGHFAGRSFKSKEDFLRELRGGKAQSLAPTNNQPQFEKKIHD